MALWEGERRQTMWEDYMAVNSWMLMKIAGHISGNTVEIPPWMELAYPEEKVEDTRTPAQIKADILRGLGA